ncbi:hypothetical protein SASPL_113023 [Salvia splendens]|uniref:Uncharacterized protein n=1 Tax=Salvia splendens TaxID=180675 RepID=A0A8X8XY69_SALSN|nr:hypothetical protein SASPL_113023 [Salvia splendens]
MASSGPVLDPLQAPPMQMAAQEAYAEQPGNGAVGPLIGVLVVITILGAIAVMIGRLCSGRGIMGHARYDFEKWVETKCASCIDGGHDPPPPRVVLDHRVTIASAAPEVANQTHPQTQQQQQHE